jgi:GNAT superfamily N-acetyltransferase
MKRRCSSAATPAAVRVVRAGAAAAAAAEHPSGAAIASVINWAYRGKHAEGDPLAWTGERHLLSGKRVTTEELEATLERCDAPRPREMLLLALADDPTGGGSSTKGAGRIVGTVHVHKLRQQGMCEIGMFSVDPDQQGRGIGGVLLHHAETFARDSFAADTLVMHVLEGRNEIQAWYKRCGYSAVPGAPKTPFPFGPDALSTPLVAKETLNFLRLEKPASIRETATAPVGYPFDDYETAAQYEREQAWTRSCEQKQAEELEPVVAVEADIHGHHEHGLRRSALLQSIRSQPADLSIDREELYKAAIDACVAKLARREALGLFEVGKPYWKNWIEWD